MTYKDQFIAELYPAAVKIWRETGMSKELILAQAAQETGWGQHTLAGTHNIFNIKASADWNGPTETFKVWEIENGQKIWKDQKFRVYESTEEALRDRVKFLQKNPRYTLAGLFDEGTKGNLSKEAAALQKAGYATDPLYATHLIAVYSGPTMQHAVKLAQTRTGGGILAQGDHGSTVRDMQAHLAALGYSDAHGNALKPDGNFGPDTRRAVEAFQRDYQLAIDGKVGPETRHTIDALLHPGLPDDSPSLADLSHPDHLLFSQVREQVQRLDAALGRTPDQRSDNLAGALTVAAKHKGMFRIDEVAINEDGSRAFVIQSHTGYSSYAEVVTADAVTTPMTQSSATALTEHAQAAPCWPCPVPPEHQIHTLVPSANLLP